MKICSGDCKHCQPYNQSWCICWHPLIKGSKVQMLIECTVNKVKRDKAEEVEYGD